MTKALIAIALSLLPGAAWAQQTTIQPFMNGYQINRNDGSVPTTVTPFLNGYQINRNDGSMPSTVQPFGNGYIVNEPLGFRPIR